MEALCPSYTMSRSLDEFAAAVAGRMVESRVVQSSSGMGEEEVERCPECGCWAMVGLELGVSSAVDGENYLWRLCVEGWRG